MKTTVTATLFLSLLLCGAVFAQFGEDFGTNTKSGRLGPRKVHVQSEIMHITEALPSTPVPPSVPPKNVSDIDKLRQKLEERTTIELDENDTFENFFNILKEKHDIQTIVDPRGAGALGITASSPVVREPFRRENVPLRRALQLILREQDLTYVIDEGFLQITSEIESKRHMKVKVYPVADLVFDPYAKPMPQWVLKPAFTAWANNVPKTESVALKDVKMAWEYQPDVTFDFSELMDLIEAVVAPDSWDEGGDMMEFYPGLCLVVRQTDEVHDQVEHLLAELRAKRVGPSKKISESKEALNRRLPVRRLGFGAFRRR